MVLNALYLKKSDLCLLCGSAYESFLDNFSLAAAELVQLS